MQTGNKFESHHGTYDDLAPEYYDSGRHPTSANFREASRKLLFPWFRELIPPNACILEVGAGCSIVSEWLAEVKWPVARFIASDLSLKMLSYSGMPGSPVASVVCDAQQLPFTANSFDYLVSSLGDPYNTPLFWKEAARVLRIGAYSFFTTPSFEWAQQFRDGDSHAEFLVSGGHILVPSYIKSLESQRILIEESGLTFTHYRDLEEAQLTTK